MEGALTRSAANCQPKIARCSGTSWILAIRKSLSARWNPDLHTRIYASSNLSICALPRAQPLNSGGRRCAVINGLGISRKYSTDVRVCGQNELFILKYVGLGLRMNRCRDCPSVPHVCDCMNIRFINVVPESVKGLAANRLARSHRDEKSSRLAGARK